MLVVVSFLYILGREIPYVARIVNPDFEGFYKSFFRKEQIAILVHTT